MRWTDMLNMVREVQIPILAVLLVGGCTAKTHRAITGRPADAETGPAVMFPPRLRGPAVISMSGAEFILGAGLLVTAEGAGGGSLALGFRAATAVLFCMAAAALHELRARRPDAGCGCFGELSGTPVNWRTIARAAALCAAALATIGVPPLRMPSSPAQAALVLAIIIIELAVLAALSPEVGAVMVRLGDAEPCELRRVSVARTMDALRASGPWRRYRSHLVSTEPLDVWREECWRFFVFPGMRGGRRVDVVFAVSLDDRHGRVRTGLLDVAVPAARHTPSGDPLQISNRL